MAVTEGRAVRVLVSIDPVGRFRPSWPSIRAAARFWLNVRAEPSSKNHSSDDVIASIGGKYSRPPERGEPGAPDFSIIADATHGAFRQMMRQSVAGVSGASLLGGNRVP